MSAHHSLDQQAYRKPRLHVARTPRKISAYRSYISDTVPTLAQCFPYYNRYTVTIQSRSWVLLPTDLWLVRYIGVGSIRWSFVAAWDWRVPEAEASSAPWPTKARRGPSGPFLDTLLAVLLLSLPWWIIPIALHCNKIMQCYIVTCKAPLQSPPCRIGAGMLPDHHNAGVMPITHPPWLKSYIFWTHPLSGVPFNYSKQK